MHADELLSRFNRRPEALQRAPLNAPRTKGEPAATAPKKNGKEKESTAPEEEKEEERKEITTQSGRKSKAPAALNR